MNHPNNFPNNNSIMIFCRTSSGWEGRGIHIQWFFMASRSYEQSFQPYDKSRDIDRLFNGYLPSGKLTQLWKITIFHGKIGKSTISMAIFNVANSTRPGKGCGSCSFFGFAGWLLGILGCIRFAFSNRHPE
jgi:hypothetical protein